MVLVTSIFLLDDHEDHQYCVVHDASPFYIRSINSVSFFAHSTLDRRSKYKKPKSAAVRATLATTAQKKLKSNASMASLLSEYMSFPPYALLLPLFCLHSRKRSAQGIRIMSAATPITKPLETVRSPSTSGTVSG